MANKIYSVVVGDVNGRLSEVFAKLSILHTKQSFAFAILAGNLFADPADASDAENDELVNLLKGNIEVPLPTYFALGTRDLPTLVTEKLGSGDGELCPNLSLLGRRVSIKTSEGVMIVAVGGSYEANSLDNPMSLFKATYNDDDTAALAKDLGDIDFLVTSDWPAAVRDGASASKALQTPSEVQSIADLCTALKPRYHFSTSEAYYEREPFFHDGLPPRSVTRFVSLAPFGNPEKQKAMYAFSFEPSIPPPKALPEGCTASPFTSTKKRKLEPQQDSYNNFRYSNGNRPNHYEPDQGRRKRQKYQPPPNPDQCFFCLSNPTCETHMIGSIGTDCYVTVAKGPLSTRATFPDLGCPGHMLIVPLQHSPTFSAMADEGTRQSTVTELGRYRSALHDMLAAKSKGNDGRSKLGSVTWEISRGRGVHLHWQFLPVPVDLVQKRLVEAAFDVEAENLSYPKFAKNAAAIAEAEKGDYLKVMIWSEALRKEMVLPIDQSFAFDLQFGRKVLAMLLRLENRIDWRACAQAKAEEEADAAAFKEAFKEFDFSLEDD